MIFLCLISYGCPEEICGVDSSIFIVNNWTKDIYFDSQSDSTLYSRPPIDDFFVPANTSFELRGCFIHRLSDEDKLYLWIFDKEVVNNTPWEEIVANELYLTRFELTLEELKEMGWVIIFTGE